MDSPLSPIVANLVMQGLAKEEALNKVKIELPLYLRYVDDILLIASGDRINSTLTVLILFMRDCNPLWRSKRNVVSLFEQ